MTTTTTTTPSTHYTEPTTTYWQEILPAPSTSSSAPPTAPWQYAYPAVLPDTRILLLPIRRLPREPPRDAVASLIINQAALTVAAQLAAFLAERVRPWQPEVIIGVPTLGLGVAGDVARELGLERYVPLGYSRKFWYEERLSTSTAVASITSPEGRKKLYLDPNQRALVAGKRAVLIDDAVSSGATLAAAWDFLEGEQVGAEIVGCGVLMKQGERWREVLGRERSERMVWVFESPLLRKVEGGWDVRE